MRAWRYVGLFFLYEMSPNILQPAELRQNENQWDESIRASNTRGTDLN